MYNTLMNAIRIFSLTIFMALIIACGGNVETNTITQLQVSEEIVQPTVSEEKNSLKINNKPLNTTDPIYLNPPKKLTKAQKVVQLIKKEDIDPITGCGTRNYIDNGELAARGHLLNYLLIYPDGVGRNFPTGHFQWSSVAQESIDLPGGMQHIDNEIYWNNFLGLSPNIKEITANRSKVIKSDAQANLIRLASKDKLKYWEKDEKKYWEQTLEKSVTLSGYPLVFPADSELVVSDSTEDIAYWDFNGDGRNTIEGGFDWSFRSDIKGLDAYIKDGILTLPSKKNKVGKWGVTGSVELSPRESINKSLDRDAFTLGFSILPEALSTKSPYMSFKENMTSEEIEEFDRINYPGSQFFTFGQEYRWLNVGLNNLCQLEIGLNLTPFGDTRNHHGVYLVSEKIVDILSWNEIYFTIDKINKQASITINNSNNTGNKTEYFSLPDDFIWSFEQDWNEDRPQSIMHFDNNLGLFNTSGAGGFEGKIDWIYLANGVMTPNIITEKLGKVRSKNPPIRTVASIQTSPSGYSASALLSKDEYSEWKNGGFSNSSLRDYLTNDLYAVFEDAYDFIFLVQNENDTSLNYAGLYHGVSNNIKGISEDIESLDRTKYTGSNGKLKALIYFPTNNGIASGPSLHELMHHWGNFSLSTDKLAVTSFDENVLNSNDVLNEINGSPHWGISSVNGQLGGFDKSTLKSLGNNWYSAAPFGTNANGANSIKYSDLELYLMGLIPQEQVEDIILFKNIEATAKDFIEDRKWYAEEKRIVKISDIINKLGSRVPNYIDSQKSFNILTLIITDKDLTEPEWEFYDSQSKGFEKDFTWATDNKATVNLSRALN
jgi:hypothetical protein